MFAPPSSYATATKESITEVGLGVPELKTSLSYLELLGIELGTFAHSEHVPFHALELPVDLKN